MQIGPVCSDLEPPSLGGGQAVFVGLRCGQGAGGDPLGDTEFAHTIWRAADPPQVLAS
jgi:hypothetical protein